MKEFPGFEHAYRHQLGELLHAPQFRNAPRGVTSQERLAVTFALDNPRRRLVIHPARRSNLVFNFAEALWYLAGRDDVSYLAHYAPGVARYSADGHRLTGTAYGPRIFRHGSSALDQWSAVVDLLRADPDSKRAVIQVFRPDELDAPDNRDVACTLALQFLIREERLHTIGYMRANDAYRGMVSDVFSFTFLQEMMARQLGVALGPYTHVAGSLHLDRPDLERARRLVGAGPAQGLPPDVMPPMPDGDNWSSLWRVMTIEEALRADDLRLDATTLDGLDLPEYWEHVLVLFELHRRERYGTGEADGLAGRLPPLYRQLLFTRFPNLATDRTEVITTDAAV